MKNLSLVLGFIVFISIFSIPSNLMAANWHIIVIDPGHGGEEGGPSPFEGDHWDNKKKEFLYPFGFGAKYIEENMYEHRIVLQICKKVEKDLKKATTVQGFKKFKKILYKYGTPLGQKFIRPKFKIYMTRHDSFEDEHNLLIKNIDRFYRLYDSPLGFKNNGHPYKTLYPGRISFTNMHRAELQVSIHANSSTRKEVRGISAVLTPNYRIFKLIDMILKRYSKIRASEILFIISYYFGDIPILSKLDILDRDVKTYFEEDGNYPRSDMVTWYFKNRRNKYWKREKSKYEIWRRGCGKNVGGDNLVSTNELIGFIRMALINKMAVDRKINNKYLEEIGPVLTPYSRDYAMPMLVNSVSSFVEIGFLSNEKDRNLIKKYIDQYAEGIEVGIYSIFYGMKPSRKYNKYNLKLPTGKKINFEKYGKGYKSYFYAVYKNCKKIPKWIFTYVKKYKTFPKSKISFGKGDFPVSKIISKGK